MGGKGTPWHHDHTFWPLAGKQIASVWAAMESVSAEGSALEFVAGSHLWNKQFQAISATGQNLSSEELEPLPDIDNHREDYRILSWELEPGDALLFNALILHGSRPNSGATMRRAITTRWTGDDVRYSLSNKPIRELWEHDLQEGDALSGPLFPQVLPELIEAQVGIRMRGPISPDPERYNAFIASIRTMLDSAS